MKLISKLVASFVFAATLIFGTVSANAVIYSPASSGITGVTVTPGFTQSWFIPSLGGTNPDLPSGNSNLALEQFIERPTIYGGDVGRVGGARLGSRGGTSLISAQIYLLRVNNIGFLMYMYAAQPAAFTFALAPSIVNNAPITLDAFKVISPPTTVPIPAPFWMLGTALLGMTTLRRRYAVAAVPARKR
jgi:hypothetical protein